MSIILTKEEQKLFEATPDELRAIVDRAIENKQAAQMRETARKIEVAGIVCLCLAEYLAQRCGSYCGDINDHECAMRQAARQRKNIRKVLGYAVP